MKVAIIKSKKRWFLPGILVKWLTGCRAYHIGFYNEKSGKFYDMGVHRRTQFWLDYYKPERMQVEFFSCTVKEAYLAQQVKDNPSKYGYVDYFLFLFRWLGFRVKNRSGMICSEMVNKDLRRSRIKTPWETNDSPPSPCDFLEWYKNGSNQV